MNDSVYHKDPSYTLLTNCNSVCWGLGILCRRDGGVGVGFGPMSDLNHLHTCACPAGLLSAVDMVEVNPLRGQTEKDVQSTVSTAVDLLLGCFGRLREGNHSSDYSLPEPWLLQTVTTPTRWWTPERLSNHHILTLEERWLNCAHTALSQRSDVDFCGQSTFFLFWSLILGPQCTNDIIYWFI